MLRTSSKWLKLNFIEVSGHIRPDKERILNRIIAQSDPKYVAQMFRILRVFMLAGVAER